LRRLETIARTGSAASNRRAYEAFLALDATNREALVRSIVILDAAQPINDVFRALRYELRRAAAQQHLDALADRLVESVPSMGYPLGRV